MTDFQRIQPEIEGHAITCQELVALVTAYLDGALSPDECARFEAHLAICEGCQHHLLQVRKTIELVGELREADLSVDTRDRLLLAFRSWKQDGINA